MSEPDLTQRLDEAGRSWAMPEPTAPDPGRIEFPNGWSIDVHFVEGGEVYYRSWPPDCEEQGLFERCHRMPVDDFRAAVAAALAEEGASDA